MTTQENMHAPGYKERQELVTICGQSFWADPEMVPLLKALNEAGLITRSHCSGHGENPSWVAIRLESIFSVEVRTHGEYSELLLTWKRAAEDRPTERRKED